jgi:eukaryotic-like serine/threonine-protein kinase
MSSETATLAHRYVLGARTASGGMATVWRARDDVLARTVAVKILHSHLAADDDFLRRFRHEALAAARLSHPNIVAIYDSGAQADADGVEQHYIVMEHCGGGTLADMVRSSGPLPPEQAVAVGAAICEALSYAHRAGVVHRDIKPANVLLGDGGSVKVADFGIAKAAFASGDITTTGAILGTVTYMAPEQVVGLEPDERSDLYSLGVVMYELLTGRPPFAGDTQLATALAHQHEAPPALRSLRVGIPKPLEAAVLRALAKDASERFASAEEMRAALGAGARRNDSTGVLPATPDASEADAPVEVETARGAEYTKIVPVVLFVALAVALAFVLPSLLGSADTGPPDRRAGGGASSQPAGSEGAGTLRVRSVQDFDPHVGDGENPEEAPLAVDGDEATAWTTSTYSTPLAEQKPGVGLRFDLGRPRDVTRVTLESATPGYAVEVRAGSEEPGDERDLDLIDGLAGAPGEAEMTFEEPVSARYWLVWITALPGGGGGSASLNEVTFLGS